MALIPPCIYWLIPGKLPHLYLKYCRYLVPPSLLLVLEAIQCARYCHNFRLCPSRNGFLSPITMGTVTITIFAASSTPYSALHTSEWHFCCLLIPFLSSSLFFAISWSFSSYALPKLPSVLSIQPAYILSSSLVHVASRLSSFYSLATLVFSLLSQLCFFIPLPNLSLAFPHVPFPFLSHILPLLYLPASSSARRCCF